MITLRISEAQFGALDDALSYYEASDYGCGGGGPADDTQREHVRAIKALQEKITNTHAEVAREEARLEHEREYGIK